MSTVRAVESWAVRGLRTSCHEPLGARQETAVAVTVPGAVRPIVIEP